MPYLAADKSKLAHWSSRMASAVEQGRQIGVGTAAAHLAGALGKTCWVLLPYYQTDWRWLTARDDTPWYPGVMRLFRQTSMGDWAGVVSEVHSALRSFRCPPAATRLGDLNS